MTPDSEIAPAEAERLLDDLTAIVARAAAGIRATSPSDVERRTKADRSPVTTADEASEVLIMEGLAKLAPSVPILSEEAASRGAAPALGKSFFVVDPLDGTREFLAGRDEFTVNLAIVTGTTPIAGIIASPMRGLIWRGIAGGRAERLRVGTGGGIEKPQKINARRWPAQGVVAAVSRSHLDGDTEAFLTRLGLVQKNSSGSAVKFCLLAEGSADVYPRLSPTCEWDVAAGHALLSAAGGIVTRPDGTPLTYGNSAIGFRVPAFVAWADPAKAASFGA